MAKYKCSVCGYLYDEEKEGKPFAQLGACPVCRQPAAAFQEQKETEHTAPGSDYRYMKEIQEMSCNPVLPAPATLIIESTEQETSEKLGNSQWLLIIKN